MIFCTLRRLRDLIGQRKEKLEIPDGSTIGDLKGTLGERGDRIAQAINVALFSINREFAFAEEMLQEGDEVGVFPPVSGGAQHTILAVTEDVLDLDQIVCIDHQRDDRSRSVHLPEL